MLKPKVIRIDGVIGQGEDEVSADYVRQHLPANGTDPIRVSIHSEGGSVFEGFAIYDALVNYSGLKTISVESTAFSIASFIAMAFDDIEMSPNAYLMLHNPRVGMEGDDDELASTAGMIGKLKANMIEAYAKRSGKTTDEIAAILKAETYFNATDAVANGFANRITNKPVQARAFARLDRMPHGVVAALFGAGFGGDTESYKDQSMSDSKALAATVQDIRGAFPKAKSDFIVKCLERQLPLASVAQVAAEEMMTENETLAMKVAAMEEELITARSQLDELAARAKAMEDGEEEEEEEMAKAKAEYDEKETAKAKRTGVAPIARGSGVKPTASVRWNEAVELCLPKVNGNKTKAVALANKQNPGLREAYVAEVNAR